MSAMTASVAIDGSKFKAVNTRDKNFTSGKVERRRAQLEKSVARYLAQLDTADLQEPSEELAAKTAHLKEKLVKLESEMQRLAAMEKLMLASPDQQISLTDPDSRSMATSSRGSGVVGYNVQVAVDTKHHLIVAHEVTNEGSDRAQLANIACQAKEALGVDELQAVADRGYFNSDEGQKQTSRSEISMSALPPKADIARRPLDARFVPEADIGRYSITSSAMASTPGGMVRPSAFAVLRFITNSNLVGCSIGRSDGFAPRKILSTYSAAFRNKSEKLGP